MSSSSGKRNQQQFVITESTLNSEQFYEPSPSSQDQSLKVQELHSLCKELISTNRYLNEEIQILKEELEAKTVPSAQNIFTDQYSEIQLDFTDIEQNIKDYRKELERYQNKISQQLGERARTIAKLKQEVAKYHQKEENQCERIDELESERQALIQAKNSLLAEIEELKIAARASKLQSPRSIRKSNDYNDMEYYEHATTGNSFNNTVQQQLEKLIKKLIKQLEHERYSKRRLIDENRRLQKELMDLEKEAVLKNNKIYELQLLLIKNAKQTIQYKAGYNHKILPFEESPRGRHKQPNKPQRNGKAFTFLQVINEQVKISSKEKLVVALKTIDFYIAKIQHEDLYSHTLESITICNFIPSNTKLITIKANKNSSDFQEDNEHSEEEVLWNMAFLLENFLRKKLDSLQNFAELSLQMDIIDYLNQMIENKDKNDLNSAFELKKIVENTINCCK